MKQKTIFLFITICFFTSFVWAQGGPKLQLTVTGKKMNMSQAEKTGQLPVQYLPGDIISYTIIARNVGDGIMKEPVVTDPIPDGVIYKPESAEGEKSAIEFSINGGDTYQSWPPVYRIKNNAGEIIEKEASPDMITHIRWTVKEALAPMRSKKLEFEVIVK